MKNLILTLLSLFLIFPATAQEEEQVDNRPVRKPFEAAILIDNQTVVSPLKGGFEYQIQHRFGLMTNGLTDLFGIYGSSNIRMGINYGITDKLMVGFGTTKNYKLQDFQWKYAIIQQTRSGSIPVSVSYYGNMVVDARHKDNFGPAEEFKGAHRLSYFNQIIVSRRFDDRFSFLVAPGFLHFNALENGLNNSNFSLSAGGKATVLGNASIVAEYHQLLNKQELFEPKPNLSLGIEIGTATHCFHIFVANYSHIIQQRNLLYNVNEIGKGDFLLGFNITVRF